MVERPKDGNAFEFVILAALRAKQLMRGCTPKVPSGHKLMITAQMEVAAGEIATIIVPAVQRRRKTVVSANGGSHVEAS